MRLLPYHKYTPQYKTIKKESLYKNNQKKRNYKISLPKYKQRTEFQLSPSKIARRDASTTNNNE